MAIQAMNWATLTTPGLPCEELFGVGRWDDKDFVLEKIQQDPANYRRASDRLRDDTQVFLKARHGAPEIGQWGSKRIRNNSSLMQPILKAVGERALDWVGQDLWNAEYFALRVAGKFGLSGIARASDDMKENRKVQEAAWMWEIRQDATRWRNAPDWLKDDKKFVLIVCNLLDPRQFLFASERLRGDQASMEGIIRDIGVEAFSRVTPSLWNNGSFVLKMVKRYGEVAFNYASASLRENREVLTALWAFKIKEDSKNFQYAPEWIRNDRGICRLVCNPNQQTF